MHRGNVRRPYPRLRVEALEDRAVPAVYVVNTLADENNGIGVGNLSLREAVAAATANPDADTIQFAVMPGTINLGSALPALSGTILIDGPGAANLTVRRNAAGNFAVFSVASDANIEFRGLTVTNGSLGGVAATDANLTLTDCAFSGNLAGGAVVYSSSTAHALIVDGCTFTANMANGAALGNAIRFSTSGTATLAVMDSTITNSPLGTSTIHVSGGTATLTNITISTSRGVLATGATLGVTGCTFTSDTNSAISATNTHLSVADSVFTGNGAGNFDVATTLARGGAIFTAATATGYTATVTNSTFVGNVAGNIVPGGFVVNGAGGAIYAGGVDLLIDGCTLDGNGASIYGQAVLFQKQGVEGAALVMRDTVVRNHTLVAGYAVQGLGATTSSQTSGAYDCTFTDCTFDGNALAIFTSGGTGSTSTIERTTFTGQTGLTHRVYINGAGTTNIIDSDYLNGGSTGLGVESLGALTITGSTFAGNDSGGVNFAGGGTLTVSGSTLVGNTKVGDGGGAAFTQLSSLNPITLRITDSTFADNTAINGGGLVAGGASVVERSTFSGNHANVSGGGAVISAGGVVVNSTFSGNTANVSAGGLSANGQVLNCTITDNRADADGNNTGTVGGLVLSGSSSVIHNTIVAGNFQGSGSVRRDIQGGTGASSNNLIGVNTGTTLTNGVNGNLVGTVASPIDPRLAPLANNGGPTQTHALLLDSPALDAGNDAVVNAATDQRGAVRIADGPDPDDISRVDIGASESGTRISSILPQTTVEEGDLSVPFQVGDASLPGLVVTATSDNPTLLPNDTAHLEVAGTGASRSLVIRPALDQWGDATITVTVTRGVDSSSTTFHLLVRPVNDLPLAAADAYSTAEDTPLAAGSVLDNDDDYHNGAPGEDNIPLEAQLVAGPAHAAAFALAADGTFTYTPAADFAGTDTFTYRAFDTLGGGSNVATVTITVDPVNDAPAAADDAYDAIEDVPLVVPVEGVLGNDIDADGDPLTVAVVTGPAHGSLALAPDGSFSYTLDENFNGTDTFTYRAFDGEVYSAEATVTITVGPVNDTPTADAQTAETDEDAGLALTLTGDDGDPEATQPRTFVIASGRTHGTITAFDPETGALTYQPAADYFGEDSFTFVVSDGELTSEPATVSVSVRPVNDPPTAGADEYTLAEDGGVPGPPNVLGTDSDPEGDGLTAELLTGPAHGQLTLNPDGTFTYTPDPDFNGTDTFTYRVFDGAAYSDPATVTLTVTPVNDAPTATDGTEYTGEDGVLSVAGPGVLAGAADVDADLLTAELVSGPAHGTLVLNPDGSYTFAPAPNFSGTDSFTYRVYDGQDYSAPATVTVTVTPANDPPTASPDAAVGVEDGGAVVIDVLGNDDDAPDAGETLAVVGVTQGAHGAVAFTPTGLTYTPDADFYGIDSFTYTVSDGNGGTTTATVFVSVNPVNDSPTAQPDIYSTAEDAELTSGSTLANDTDIDSAGLTATLVQGPAHGLLIFAPDGGFTYRPEANFHGTDTFTYRAYDGEQYSDVVAVTLLVTSVNDSPTASAGADAAGTAGQPITLIGTFTDPDAGDTHSFRWQVAASNGQTVADGTTAGFTFTPSAAGTYTLTFTVTDAAGASASDTVVVTVTGGNHAPVITSVYGSGSCCGDTGENEWVTVTARFTDADPNDGHTAVIDWGDGTTSIATVGGWCGADYATGRHRYATGGVYHVTVRVIDAAGESDVATTTPYITGAGVHDGVLQIVGTRCRDQVSINAYGQSSLKVHADFFGCENFRTYSLAGLQRIEVYLCGGDDHATVSGQINLSAILDGGSGDDHLNGGGGNEVLLGGGGCDMLVGGSGRDLLIGGFGADRLVGNANEDILIGGYTDYDGDTDALSAILGVWTGSGNYQARVAALQAASFAHPLAADVSVHDDVAVDRLTGSAGTDWFFANVDGGVRDQITDLAGNESTDDVDP